MLTAPQILIVVPPLLPFGFGNSYFRPTFPCLLFWPHGFMPKVATCTGCTMANCGCMDSLLCIVSPILFIQEDETVRLEQARALKDNMDLIMPVADHPKVDNSVPNPLEAPERQTPVQNMALSAQPPASTEPQRPTGLKVVVLQGQDLQKTDDLSGVRPYVKLSFGGQLKQTTAESSAVWNEEFDFTIPQVCSSLCVPSSEGPACNAQLHSPSQKRTSVSD